MQESAREQARPPEPAQFESFLARLRSREEHLFIVLSLLIGAIVGAVVVAFIVLSERLGARLYPPGSAPWRHLVVPLAGTLVTGFLLYRYAPSARGSGVPQAKAALYAREGGITLRTVVGKFFLTSASLACGIPLGREGPSVQVGAGIASLLARRLGLSEEKCKGLLIAGAAAAIAAAFNTPLAAVLFTLEEIVGDLHAPVLGSVVLSSATSWMMLRLLLGNEPLFHTPQYQLANPAEFLLYALLGILGGAFSVAFVKLLLFLRTQFMRLPAHSQWLQPAMGGAAVGLLAWFVPEVLGVGYSHVSNALNGGMILQLMAMLVLLKIATVALAYASGNAGGIFGPSLFIGAMLGGTVGSVARLFFPAHVGPVGAYALVGMGALFAGIIRAPMTSVIMIFEITRDYAIIVPLMIANLLSFFISRRYQPQQIYEALARQEGVHLPSGEWRERQGKFRVGATMRLECPMLDAQLTLQQAGQRAAGDGASTWLVSDEFGVRGVLRAADLRAAAEKSPDDKLISLLPQAEFPHVHQDHPLDLAMERMGASGLEFLPVVSRMNVRQLEGAIFLKDILRAYGLPA